MLPEDFIVNLLVAYANRLGFVVVMLIAFAVVGCGESDPTANLPPEKKAPDPMQLGEDPEYAKKFGSKKK